MKAPRIDVYCTGANDSSRVLIKRKKGARERKENLKKVQQKFGIIVPALQHVSLSPAFTFRDLGTLTSKTRFFRLSRLFPAGIARYSHSFRVLSDLGRKSPILHAADLLLLEIYIST